ncbi:hypothetical protein ACIPVB_08955 [Microbacterium sp. NPDC090007]|uniref:hypothetical protein n=1 Tax=Microbacterium sp. NPDC090007 TaxID=3364204 RepID=UPI00381B9A2E
MLSMPYGSTVYRLRAGTITDPYSGLPIGEDWGNPEPELVIEQAFIASTSTSMLGDATRAQALEAKSLYCDDSYDIAKGDRIRDGENGPVYTIDGLPSTGDVNPFTGWKASREIPLTRYLG